MRRLNARSPTSPNNENKAEMMESPAKFQFRPSPTSTSLFSSKSNSRKSSNYCLIILLLLSLPFLSYYFLFPPTTDHHDISTKYAIVIDGGSSGTRVHILEFGVLNGSPVFDFTKSGSMKVKPGLSSFKDDPEGAAVSVMELLEFAKRKVPKEFWASTEVRLMATAGLRLLDLKDQDLILEACRKVIRVSGFKFVDHWASVISGSDEGKFAWVVANYAMGTLGGDPEETTGIIELGGASAQVTFIAREPVPAEQSISVRFGNHTYNLYSQSFLHYGQDVAFHTLQESLISSDLNMVTESLLRGRSVDPCTPKGYPHGMRSSQLSPDSMVDEKKTLSSLLAGGNFSQCRSAALTLLQKGKEKCSHQHCSIGSIFVPKLHGRFLATENFFYTSKFFGLGPRSFLSDLLIAGEQYCKEDWVKLKTKYDNEEDLLRYCFSSAYIVALLHDSFGIALDDRRISFTNQVGDIPLDWALGAFILQSTTDSETERPDWIASIISNSSPMILKFFVVAMLLIFALWSLSKWKKPQLKTIYDLEKGRYIVTRVGR